MNVRSSELKAALGHEPTFYLKFSHSLLSNANEPFVITFAAIRHLNVSSYHKQPLTSCWRQRLRAATSGRS